MATTTKPVVRQRMKSSRLQTDLPFSPLSGNSFRLAFVAKKHLAKFRGAEQVERRIMGARSQATSSSADRDAISEVGGIFDPVKGREGHQEWKSRNS